METKIFKPSQIKEVLEWVKEGKLIAFPTDTVYGLGVIGNNEQALQNLKKAKTRDAHKPIPYMVSSIKQIDEVAHIDERSLKLIQNFMPGGLTVILRKKDHVPAFVSNGLDTIAIRMPDDTFLLKLLEEPMLVTSANLSGEDPGSNEREVLEQLDGRIDGIVAGEARANIASTIVDLTNNEMHILREGEISKQEILDILEEE
ncbi:L-threonylcarbamoyladenylate synthase [Breznakia sp. PF5-3]|uniref:L-threonylcarbamoyladenylate synthase n=1 Tax=unclassified Breznakia TaxID=2623764 RepID=UPI002405BC47|nr:MULTISPECIES: L-threonylcarbamoyladenylate synthase [unclassified Breznakia]MDF9825833.1 L-threonylcarbamoyladenylate synthase [Breznakia sp. PM6-1]MDF9836638.1 L-threonylcarbamoyladenylate synthase [Breznakia sp. PF5-3]MDF9838885.1 L-threonylcarbamoyladenylate synthase [Breznakia sp. PFB2-8]MDF9860911.1 L-threonylcarbamoyladenylate synthase [Breznakia sp. PH5-24]